MNDHSSDNRSKMVIFAKKHRTLIIILTFIFFIIIGGCAFPIYNLNREWSTMLTISILASAIAAYGFLGTVETQLFPNAKIYHIIPLNLVLIMLSMIFRYFLEFGEVSNTYNFTMPNIILHVAATLIISISFWRKVSLQKD